MSKPAAPSMPTPKQVTDTNGVVVSLCPQARIKSVGPEGITFLYPDEIGGTPKPPVQPFSGGK